MAACLPPPLRLEKQPPSPAALSLPPPPPLPPFHRLQPFSSCPELTVGVCSGCKAHQIVPASLGRGPGTRRTCDWEEGARSASVPRPRRVGAWPMSQQRGPSVTMAIRVFQPPRCQIYGGGEKRSQNAITVGKGQSTFRERALPCSPKGLGISPFSLSAGCQRARGLSGLPWDGNVPASRCMGGHACRLGKAVQARPQLNGAGVTAVGSVNDYLLHVRLRKSEQGKRVRPDPIPIPVPIPCSPPCSCVPVLALPHHALTVPQGPGFNWRWKTWS